MDDILKRRLPLDAIRAYCATQPIERLAVFGSALRDDFGTASDVDLLVDLKPDAKVGFFKLVEMQATLARLLERPVDLLTRNSLSPYFRTQVIANAEVIYEAKSRE